MQPWEVINLYTQFRNSCSISLFWEECVIDKTNKMNILHSLLLLCYNVQLKLSVSEVGLF